MSNDFWITDDVFDDDLDIYTVDEINETNEFWNARTQKYWRNEEKVWLENNQEKVWGSD